MIGKTDNQLLGAAIRFLAPVPCCSLLCNTKQQHTPTYNNETMEESKLQALADSLSKNGNRKGLGTNRSPGQYSWSVKQPSTSAATDAAERTDGLPNNALYTHFVKAGEYDPTQKTTSTMNHGDGRVIKRDFSDLLPILVSEDGSDGQPAKKMSKEEKKAAKKAAKLEAKRQAKLEEKRQMKKLAKEKSISKCSSLVQETSIEQGTKKSSQKRKRSDEEKLEMGAVIKDKKQKSKKPTTVNDDVAVEKSAKKSKKAKTEVASTTDDKKRKKREEKAADKDTSMENDNAKAEKKKEKKRKKSKS